MGKKIILFTLQTFSTTGGIQKMTRTLGHSLNKIAERNNWKFTLWSAYDKNTDLIPQYVPLQNFKGFGGNRIGLLIRSIFGATRSDIIILSHINLALVGLIIKFINPGCQIWLIAHGIEVWRPLSIFKKTILKKCSKIICVSNFTKEQMIARHSVDLELCYVLNNSIDPFMKLPTAFEKSQALVKKYNLSNTTKVLFSLTRLASTEQYKGYDQVIKVVGKLKTIFPDIKYLLAGQYDDREFIRIQKLIHDNEVTEQVILTGFVDEDELTDYFLLADLFVLPSKKEGFGIVFIEALACGLPVICGNADGSVDAIRNGELGTAFDVDNLNKLEELIINYLNVPLTTQNRRELQSRCLTYFNEQNYINSLQRLLT